MTPHCFLPSLVAALLAAHALAQPASNTCAGAPAINANQVYHGSNVGATSDVALSGCSLADSLDVWYRFTAAPAGGDYTIDTLGSALDTTLAVYMSCGGAQLACNDDADTGSGYSLVIVPLTGGQSIRIRIAGYLADEGGFDLFITPPAVPSTGACCRGASCVVITSDECTAATEHFAGAGTACNEPGNFQTPCCKADFNQNGVVTVQDVYDYLADWLSQSSGGPIIIGSADINGTGTVTVQDIYDYFEAWLANCP